jgi:steroid delta-isomerase-like uncharacterized protein
MRGNPETDSVVRGYLEAVAVGDLDQICAFYADNIVYEDTPVHRVYHGIGATKGFYVETMRSLAVRWEIDQIVATDEGFVVGGSMAGRHVHDMPGMPATDREFKVACASIATVEDGRIVRNRAFWSSADLLHQLGLVTLPAEFIGRRGELGR